MSTLLLLLLSGDVAARDRSHEQGWGIGVDKEKGRRKRCPGLLSALSEKFMIYHFVFTFWKARQRQRVESCGPTKCSRQAFARRASAEAAARNPQARSHFPYYQAVITIPREIYQGW